MITHDEARNTAQNLLYIRRSLLLSNDGDMEALTKTIIDVYNTGYAAGLAHQKPTPGTVTTSIENGITIHHCY